MSPSLPSSCSPPPHAVLQLGCYKVKVMLAEPKTKRAARPDISLGLFGAVGPLQHHLQGLGLDPAGGYRA